MMRTFLIGCLAVGLLGGVETGQGQTFLNRSAREWVKDLGAADAKARRNAAFALGKLGSAAASAGGAPVAALKQLLKQDKDAGVREAAAFALGEIAKEGKLRDANLVNDLIAALRDPDPLVKRSAAYALGCLGENAGPALNALAAAIRDPNPGVRQNVAWALGRIGSGDAVPALRLALVDADQGVRRDAAGAMENLPAEAARDGVKELVKCCAMASAEVRKPALRALFKVVEPKDADDMAGIRVLLNDADKEVKLNSAFVLAKAGDRDALPLLCEALKMKKRGDDEIRRQAAFGLSLVGKAAAAAVPDLIEALNDPDAEVKRYAAVALGRVGEGAAPAISALAGLVANRQAPEKLRIEAATALSQIGPVGDAVKEVPKLVGVLDDPGDGAAVRERVIWALRVHNVQLRNLPGVLAAFERILSEKRQADVKMLYFDSAYMLGMLKGSDAPAKTLDVLRDFLKDPTTQIFVGQAGTGKISGVEASAGDRKVSETGMGDGRIMAVQALTKIGARVGQHKEIMKELQVIADNNNLWSRLRNEAKTLLKELK